MIHVIPNRKQPYFIPYLTQCTYEWHPLFSTQASIPLDQVFRDTCTSSRSDAKVHSRDSAVCSWSFLGARFLEVILTESQKTVKSWDPGNNNHKETIPSHISSCRTPTAVLAALQSSWIRFRSEIGTATYRTDIFGNTTQRYKIKYCRLRYGFNA